MCNIKTDPNPNLFPLWFRQGSWNCDGRLNSAVWKKKNVKIFIQIFKGVFNHFSLHPREMTPSRGGPVLPTVRGVPATR